MHVRSILLTPTLRDWSGYFDLEVQQILDINGVYLAGIARFGWDTERFFNRARRSLAFLYFYLFFLFIRGLQDTKDSHRLEGGRLRNCQTFLETCWWEGVFSPSKTAGGVCASFPVFLYHIYTALYPSVTGRLRLVNTHLQRKHRYSHCAFQQASNFVRSAS